MSATRPHIHPGHSASSRNHSQRRHHPLPAPLASPILPVSQSFAEDLSRFPSESLHSFSFARPSDDTISSRHILFKRSIEFGREGMARPVPSLSTSPSELALPSVVLADNIPTTTSPEPVPSPTLTLKRSRLAAAYSTTGFPARLSRSRSPADSIFHALESDISSRTPTDEQAAIATTPTPSFALSNTQFLTTSINVDKDCLSGHALDLRTKHTTLSQGLTISQPLVLSQPLPVSRDDGHATFLPRPSQLSTASTGLLEEPGSSSRPISAAPPHRHANRWVPAAQATFITEASPPWTVLAANDLACLVFGVTKAELHKMGILEVIQEERRHWLEGKLLQVRHGPATVPLSKPPRRDKPAPTLLTKPPDQAALILGSPSSLEASEHSRPSLVSLSPTSSVVGRKNGITAHLLRKPNSRAQAPPSRTSSDSSTSPQASCQRAEVSKRSLYASSHPSQAGGAPPPGQQSASTHQASNQQAINHQASNHHNHQASNHQASIHQASIHQASIHQASIHQASIHQASIHQASIHQVSIHQASIHQASIHQASIHQASKNSVLLCGDVVPIIKRNGATGSASLWVKEKKIGLIWVLEEIHEDLATILLEEEGNVKGVLGATNAMWGFEPSLAPDGMDIRSLIPRIPRQGIDPRSGEVDFAQIARRKFYTCLNRQFDVHIPCKVEHIPGDALRLRVSSFPHMAGIIVVDPLSMRVMSSNSFFCRSLFGFETTDGVPITALIPAFDKMLQTLSLELDVSLTEGTVVPEPLFRQAATFLNLISSGSLYPRLSDGVPALHRDGSTLRVDVQMRIVKSECRPIASLTDGATQNLPAGTGRNDSDSLAQEEEEEEEDKEEEDEKVGNENKSEENDGEVVYALWVTYCRHLHLRSSQPFPYPGLAMETPMVSPTSIPLHQPSPGQIAMRTPPATTPPEMTTPEMTTPEMTTSEMTTPEKTPAAMTPDLEQQDCSLQVALPKQRRLKQSTRTALKMRSVPDLLRLTDLGISDPSAVPEQLPDVGNAAVTPAPIAATTNSAPGGDFLVGAVEPLQIHECKRSIQDFTILEDMGKGAYGHVKLARYRHTGKTVVLKYVTKRRILVDRWTRDRRLGTVPLEIHMLDYLSRLDLRHPNIVEMEAFFEDEANYYIEMIPHGLPGMDLFDYIELRSSMDEAECRAIFVQVARAVCHLHIRAHIVHRDIKDENVILDGKGRIKLIDFGSAAYIQSGAFDMFVGTIDYAAPEVLAGKPYGGKEQDVWALGILLYTMIYKENPFYNIDEIMDSDLRVPFIVSDGSIDLVRHMLDRDVSLRYDVEQVLAHPWCQSAELAFNDGTQPATGEFLVGNSPEGIRS